MSVPVKWIIEMMEAWAPAHTAEKWDNVGLLIGDAEGDAARVLTALDASEAVVREAVEGGYDLLITHHPLLFNPISRITRQEPLGRKIYSLIQNRIGLFAAHTNLDTAEGGPSDILFQALALTDKENLMPPEDGQTAALGRVGCLGETKTLAAFAAYVKERLALPAVRYAGSPNTPVRRVALCAGDASAPRYCQAAVLRQCDVYVTGDLRHHGAQEALETGLCLVDITHYAGEAPLAAAVADYLRNAAGRENKRLTVDVSKADGQIFHNGGV